MHRDDGGRPSVGVLGLGRMGATIATRLAATHRVLGWDVRDGAPRDVQRAQDAAALVRASSVILSCLPSPRETDEVFRDPAVLDAFSAGTAVFVDCSTSDPASLRSLARRIGAAGERIVDGPILGRPDRVGAWTIPLGGPREAVDRARPALAPLASHVEHVGALGSAHAIKLLNNLMFAAINVVTAEAVAACDYVGVDARDFVALVTSSNAATVSPLFRDLAPRMLAASDELVFSTRLLAKDASLANAMCEAAGAPLRLAPLLARVTRAAVDASHGDEDSAALIHLYR